MTMPLGATEEPEVIFEEEPSFAVRVVSSGKTKSIGTEFGRWRTFYIAPSSGVTLIPTQLLPRSLRRKRAHIIVNSAGPITSTPSPSQPAVPATGVAQQNTNAYPVSVAITAGGATITNVSVNGITVGTAAGTYTVPAYGAISIAYSVATPTWVWSGIATSGPQNFTDGVFVCDRDTASNVGLTFSLPGFANGGYLQIGDNVRWECQQQLYVVPLAGNSGPVTVTVCDEQYASEQKSGGGSE